MHRKEKERLLDWLEARSNAMTYSSSIINFQGLEVIWVNPLWVRSSIPWDQWPTLAFWAKSIKAIQDQVLMRSWTQWVRLASSQLVDSRPMECPSSILNTKISRWAKAVIHSFIHSFIHSYQIGISINQSIHLSIIIIDRIGSWSIQCQRWVVLVSD